MSHYTWEELHPPRPKTTFKRKLIKLNNDFCCKGHFFMEEDSYSVPGAIDVDFNGTCTKCGKQWEVGYGYTEK